MIYLIIGILLIVIGLVIKDSPGDEHAYKASFGNPLDHFSRYNHGFAVGSLALTKAMSHCNAAVYGPTGSGKTSVVIVPSLITLARGRSSIIINDCSGGELYKLTSTFFHRNGYEVLRINFTNASDSESFNPLLQVRSVNDAHTIAHVIMRNAAGKQASSDPFWEQSACGLIALLVRYQIGHTEKKYHTLQNTLRLLERFAFDGKAVDRLMVKAGATDEQLLQSYKATVVTGEKTLQSIIATARAALMLWNDSEVCKTTAANTIDFDTFRARPTVLYVITPMQHIDYLKPLTTLLFQSIFNFVLSAIPPVGSRSIFFIIEESGAMTFSDLGRTVSNVRKFSSGILLCMQDEQSLVAQYGEQVAHTIQTNCNCAIFLKGQPFHTAQKISKLLGRYSYGDEHNRSRELMTVDEVRMCQDTIVLLSTYAPLRYTPVPYYRNLWYRRLSTATPLVLSPTTVQQPPLIPFA